MASVSTTRKKPIRPTPTGSITPTHILGVIENHYAGMSPGQRAVADFIANNPTTFCFLSVQELADKALVSHATVIRFCKTIGYQGFSEFSKDVQNTMQKAMVSGHIPSSDLEIVQDFLDSPTAEQPLLQNILNTEIRSLITVAERISMEQIATCVELLSDADHIFVLGHMASYSLAVHMEQMLSKIASNVYLVPAKSAQTATMLQRMTSKSAVIAYAFPRYPAATIEFAELAANKDASIIAITNSPLSPLAKFAKVSLYVPVGVLSYIDLYAAPLAVSSVLALELSRRFPERTGDKLTEYDAAAKKMQLYVAK